MGNQHNPLNERTAMQYAQLLDGTAYYLEAPADIPLVRGDTEFHCTLVGQWFVVIEGPLKMYTVLQTVGEVAAANIMRLRYCQMVAATKTQEQYGFTHNCEMTSGFVDTDTPTIGGLPLINFI